MIPAEPEGIPVDVPILDETGSVLRRELLEFGLSKDEVERMLARGVLVRVRRGAYARADNWAALSPERRHLLAARAVLRAIPRPAVLLSLIHISEPTRLGMLSRMPSSA